MALVNFYNPDTDNLEKSYLTKAISNGITDFVIKNANKFGANDRVLIGEMGREKSEIRTVSGVSSQTVTVSAATSFSHEVDDPVYELRYDQIKIYRATSQSGTYSLLDTIDIDVDNASKITVYDDTTGTSSHWYKITYYHSISTLESSQSDAVQATGYARGTAGFFVEEFLTEIGDPEQQTVSQAEVYGWLNECNDDLQTSTSKPYEFLRTRTTLTRTANTNYIDFPTDSNGNQTMWKFDRLDYNYVDTTTDPDTNVTYILRVLDVEEFRQRFQDNTIDTTTVNDETMYVALDTAVNRFRFHPPFETTSAGVLYLHYWKYFTEINSPGDIFETPNQRLYKKFCLGSYYRKLSVGEPSKAQVSDRHFADYAVEKAKLTGANRMDKGSPRSFKLLPRTNKGWRQF